MNATTRRRIAILSISLSLAACGGGGGGGSSSTPAPTPTPTPSPSGPPALSAQCQSGSVARLALPTAAPAGQNQEVALLACASSNPIDTVQWRQTAGTSLSLTSARSAALSVELPSAGSYGFSVEFTDANGNRYSGDATLTATAASTPTQMLIRGEPSVWAGGKTSVRAWVAGLAVADYDRATVQWSQVEGPAALLGDTNAWRLLFTAPSVSQDTQLRLRASASLPDGQRWTQDFLLLVQPGPAMAAQALFDSSDPASRVYPYLATTPHAAALRDCVYRPGLDSTSLCNMGRLPVLGQETQGALPTVEQVMARVLVSNDWMGQRFEAFLREQDTAGDFRRLLNATTAIVIGGRVRPAFYWSATGAIYLDASYLWTTPQERDTVSETPDPRAAYGDSLAYATLWRYVKNNQSAGGRTPVLERGSRSTADLVGALGSLLYHELTHANDFLPSRLHTLLNSSLRVYQATPANTASEMLRAQLPFKSQPMVDLGRVQFFGETATATQRAYTPSDIAAFFSADNVTDDYNYSWPSGQPVPREDAAMLAEEALMQLRHGIYRDFAITPQFLTGASADQPVTWGQRGRIGDPTIKPRAALILAQTMPWLPAGFLDGLAAPIQLKAGRTWGENLDQAALASGQVKPLSASERALEADLDSRRRGARNARALLQR